MPPHIIMHGIPLCIIDVSIAMRSFIMSIIEGSIGIILQIIPSFPISIVILHIIGIMPMPMPIIGIIMGIPIMGFIIIGFIMPIIGFIIGMLFIIGFPIGLWFIAVIMLVATSYGAQTKAQLDRAFSSAAPRCASA